MSIWDWLVLVSTIITIVIFGIWKSRKNKSIDSYLKANNEMPWYMVGISVMATQASAITFLSAPGQAYTDGMRFVQFYFGMPLAMIFICAIIIPIYHRLKIFTAYEMLENRFDLKTRIFTASLFLIQRGMAAGLTIYAPSIILSTLLGWNIYATNIAIGGLVILYTVAGGSKAVSYTQLPQMAIIFLGMLIAGIIIFNLLPDEVGLVDSLYLAGSAGKLNIIDFNFDLNNKYNVWSGILGGFFLSLSYFGTDQSQVGRYISGKSVTEIRWGLLFNGFLKIPMQFFILFIGALIYVFFIFHTPPIFFNDVVVNAVHSSSYQQEFLQIENEYADTHQNKKGAAIELLQSKSKNEESFIEAKSKFIHINQHEKKLRDNALEIIKKQNKNNDSNDVNYIFLHFVLNFFPIGIIGLLIAVIFSASMSSTSSELNALATTSVIDIYKSKINTQQSETHYLVSSKVFTVLWGLFAILFACFANQLGSLIEAVNVLGSLFYGTILGIFLVAFFIKRIIGGQIFYAAIIAETIVLVLYFFSDISFLWFNLIGCAIVIIFSILFQMTKR